MRTPHGVLSARPEPHDVVRAYVPIDVEPGRWAVATRWLVAAGRNRRVRWLAVATALGAGLVGAVGYEIATSRAQARLLAPLAGRATFAMAGGPSPAIRYPDPGPYDIRLGYAHLPDYIARLQARNYDIDAQARSAPGLIDLVDRGVYPLYREKPQAGLRILDRDDRRLFVTHFPARIYHRFDEIPPVVVSTLLHLENRELLDSDRPHRNPAIEWDRLARAALHLGVRRFDPTVPRLGGGTLATQLEKVRHSPQGVTQSLADKARQIATASLRAYQDGERTLEAQRRVVTAYLNALPLAALAGHGEVIGLGDGLWAWFGVELDQVNRVLTELDAAGPGPYDRRGVRAYRQVVSLLAAVRRPTDLLRQDPAALDRLTGALVDDLARAGVIAPRFAAAVRGTDPGLRRRTTLPPVSFVDRKSANTVRSELGELLGVPTRYELDRLDLTVMTTIDQPAQDAVTAALVRLADPDEAAAAGLTVGRLLGRSDPAAVVYSVVLYERGPDADLLRVQADNLDQPLDVGEGTKLELGSTAKLRTLVTYLEIVAALHADDAAASIDRLDDAGGRANDPLTEWAAAYLRARPGLPLADFLEAALLRHYSASPAESFPTGGTVLTFANFDPDDDHRVLTVREAFRRSVNLVFIRLMRDIVRYHTVRLPHWSVSLLADREDPGRSPLLERFADRESRQYLDRFLAAYDGVSGPALLDRLTADGPRTPRRLAATYRAVHPAAERDAFAAFLRDRLVSPPDTRTLGALFDTHDPARLPLTDLAYLAGRHPLELWVVRERLADPDASRADMMVRSASIRRDVYRWLFRTRHRSAQDRRIRTELEIDAFDAVHRSWRRHGYPFDRLVPSYATAIGSSGDNPAGLARLLGLIQRDGLRYPARRIEVVHFAEDTPFETILNHRPASGVQVLDPSVARAIRAELVGVVEHGTGRRAGGAFVGADGRPLEIGGKTGTGDNRVEIRGAAGRRGDRVLNRTAAFAFVVGDRFHGTVVAYVDGADAAGYRFTSALPAQVFRYLAPVLAPLVGRPLAIDDIDD